MNDVQVFKNSEFGDIRVLEEDGKILFCGSDVAKALGYANVRDAVARHCRYVVKRDVPHPQSADKAIEMSFISEGDMYRLICSSKLPSAEKFESWVFDEVLPTIRKTGSYGLDVPNFKDPVAAARAWADAMEAKIALEGINKEQQLLIEEMKPKVYYTDTILQSNSLVQTTQIAKDYGMSARAFNKKLHELGVQYNTGSQWVLYQKYQDAGYAHSYTYEYTRPDGSHGTKMHLKWTQKGRLFLYNLLKDAGVLPVMEWE